MESINMTEIEDKVYDETFDKTYNFLHLGMNDNIDIAINTLLATLESLLTHSGNNKNGRGSLSQARMDAEIAATEVVWLELVEKKKALKASE